VTKIHFLDARVVSHVLQDKDLVLDAVRRAYLAHGVGSSSTPQSTFLKFPDRPGDRIIALLSRVKDELFDVAGMKWVSSVPANSDRGLQRAGATILLNSMDSGYLKAVLSAAPVNAARTAASAVLALQVVGGTELPNVGVVGSGLIASTTIHYIRHVLGLGRVVVSDVDPLRAQAAVDRLLQDGVDAVVGSVGDALVQNVVLLATTAAEPHLDHRFQHGQIVLHLSLRDLAPAVLRDAVNVVDDFEHASRERTSLNLAVDEYGSTSLTVLEIPSLLRGDTQMRAAGQAIVCSPFGLGALDVATAEMIYRRATAEGLGSELDLGDV
jgi:ornithine cyclodeaminase